MRFRTLAVTAAGAALLAGCGSTTGQDLTPAPAAASPSSSSYTPTVPAVTPTPSSSSKTTASGPKTFSLGEPATVTNAGKDVMTVTVSDAKYFDKKQQEYGKDPANGRFLQLTITAKAMPDADPEVASVNPFDFYVVGEDGTKFSHGAGNALSGLNSDGALNATNLNPGEQVKGTAAFDVPKAGSLKVAYAPATRALGYWTLPLAS